jgi:Glycosyltransferase family 87
MRRSADAPGGDSYVHDVDYRHEPAGSLLERLLAMVALASLGWLIAIPVHVYRSPLLTPHRTPVGGDFISFYAAAGMILDGRGDEIYQPAQLQREQVRIVGDTAFRGVCAFQNPPLIAVALAPLAALPFRAALLIYTGLNLAALALTVRLLRPHLPNLARFEPAAIGAALLFYPLLTTTTGGQNAPLTLLLLTWSCTALRGGNERLAGIALGLLSYKPQFGVILGLLLLASGRWRVAMYAALVAALHYAVGAWACGAEWPLALLAAIRAYWPLEHDHNGTAVIGLIEVCEQVLPRAIAHSTGISLSILVLAWTALLADRCRRVALPAALWAGAVAAALLVSPHTLWYDCAILVLPAALLVEQSLARGRTTLLGSAFLASWLLAAPAFHFRDAIGWQPLVLLPAGVLAWASSILLSSRINAAATPTSPRQAEPGSPAPERFQT